MGNNLKIEIHGCATGAPQPDAPTPCSASTNDAQTVPADWVAVDEIDGRPDIWWPFHPRQPLDFQPAIQEGDYVRLVGTVWEDDPHNHGRCWGDDDEGGHGWYELHPVDFMGKLDSFEPNPPRSTASVIAACSAGQVDVDLRPPDPQPAGAGPHYEEIITVNEGTTRSVTVHPDRITVHLDVGDRFWAYYRLFWGSPIPQPDPPMPAACPRGQMCCESGDDGCSLCVPSDRSCP